MKKKAREIVGMGNLTSLEYISNYFVCSDDNAISEEVLCWLTNAHLPHIIDKEENLLYVFNINKSYIKEVVYQYCLQNWYYRPVVNDSHYSDNVRPLLLKANQKIAENAAVYRTYTRKDDAGPFVEDGDYANIVKTAFAGTGYRNWKARFYLTRGLLSEDYSEILAQKAIILYLGIMREAASATDTDISNMRLHCYYDWYTFYIGWFDDDYEALTTIGGIRDLTAFTDKMNELIKSYGLVRNINNRCGIQGYRATLGLDMPRECFMRTLSDNEGDIHEYAIVPFKNREEYVNYLNSDDYEAYGISYPTKSFIMINNDRKLDDFIDNSDKMCHSTDISGDDHDFFWRNVQAQIDHNKAIGKSLLSNIKGIDYWDEEPREPRTEKPKEYTAAASNFNGLIEEIAHLMLGEDYETIRPTIYLKMDAHRHHRTHIIDALFITFRFADEMELNRETRRRVMEWLLEHGFFYLHDDEYVLMVESFDTFLNYLFDTIPDSHEYFKLKDWNK